MKKKHIETALIHHGYESNENKGSLTPPLFQTSTFTFETAQQGEASFAGRRSILYLFKAWESNCEII